MFRETETFRPKSRLEQLIERQHGASVETLLRRLYITEGLSQAAVAETLGVNRDTVADWMSLYRIPTRDRRKVAAA